MPDMDHLPRGLRKHWGKVFAAVSGSHHDALVVDRVEKSMAASLRPHPHSHRFIGALCDAAAQGPQEVRAAVGSIPIHWRSGIGSAFVDAAREISEQPRISNNIAQQVIELGLRRMAWQCCFGPTTSDLVGSRFPIEADHASYVERVLDATRVDSLAIRILKQDDISKLRAPARQSPPAGTKQLLGQPI